MQKAVYEERRIMVVGSLVDLESTLQSQGELEARGIVERKLRVPRGSERDVISYLFSVYYGELFRSAYRMCGDYDAANDLVQDTFIHAYTSLPDFRANSTYKYWLHRILTNNFLNYLRREKANPTEYFSSLEGDGSQPEAKYSTLCHPSIEGEVFFHTIEGAVISAINSLPEKARHTIKLLYIGGLSYEETAKRLGINLGTVKSRIARAKERLRNNGLHELLDL